MALHEFDFTRSDPADCKLRLHIRRGQQGSEAGQAGGGEAAAGQGAAAAATAVEKRAAAAKQGAAAELPQATAVAVATAAAPVEDPGDGKEDDGHERPLRRQRTEADVAEAVAVAAAQEEGGDTVMCEEAGEAADAAEGAGTGAGAGAGEAAEGEGAGAEAAEGIAAGAEAVGSDGVRPSEGSGGGGDGEERENGDQSGVQIGGRSGTEHGGQGGGHNQGQDGAQEGEAATAGQEVAARDPEQAASSPPNSTTPAATTACTPPAAAAAAAAASAAAAAPAPAAAAAAAAPAPAAAAAAAAPAPAAAPPPAAAAAAPAPAAAAASAVAAAAPSPPSFLDIPVSSLVLSAKSSFFLNLFTAGFKEKLCSSQDAAVDIHLEEEEVATFKDLLSFMYGNPLSPQSTDNIRKTVALLLMASRFGVDDCITAGLVDLLEKVNGPMDFSEAVLILEEVSFLGPTFDVENILAASKACMIEKAGALLENPADAALLRLPEPWLREVLLADELRVNSEDTVFKAVAAWSVHNFEDTSEQHGILSDLLKDVRLPWMSVNCIRHFLLKIEGLEEEARCMALDALLIKAQGREPENILDRTYRLTLPTCNLRPRAGNESFAGSISVQLPEKDCRAWATQWGPKTRTSSAHLVTGELFSLECNLSAAKDGAGLRFCLYLRHHKMAPSKSGSSRGLHRKFQFYAKRQSTGPSFCMLGKMLEYRFTEKKTTWGFPDVFLMPWSEVLLNRDEFFPDGSLELKADVWSL